MIDRILDLIDSTGIEIVSYGLAPNPDGFCFESFDASKEDIEHLNTMLDSLNSDDELKLRTIIFG